MQKIIRQKPSCTLVECSFGISPKIVLFKAGENPLLKNRHFVNSWEKKAILIINNVIEKPLNDSP